MKKLAMILLIVCLSCVSLFAQSQKLSSDDIGILSDWDQLHWYESSDTKTRIEIRKHVTPNNKKLFGLFFYSKNNSLVYITDRDGMVNIDRALSDLIHDGTEDHSFTGLNDNQMMLKHSYQNGPYIYIVGQEGTRSISVGMPENYCREFENWIFNDKSN